MVFGIIIMVFGNAFSGHHLFSARPVIKRKCFLCPKLLLICWLWANVSMFLLPVMSLFLASFINAFFGRALGHRGSAILTVGLTAIAFLSSLVIWVEVVLCGCHSSVHLRCFWNMV